MCHVARLDAVEGAAFGAFQPLAHLVEKRVVYGAARHPDGALDDLDILLAGIDVALLEGFRGVALLRGDEARAHLHAVGAEGSDVVYVLARVYASACDDGDMFAGALLRCASFGDNFGQDVLERAVGVAKLLRRVAEVSACLGPLDHDGVGDISVLLDPAAAQDLERTCRRYDRRELRGRVALEERGERERQPRTREYDVGLVGDGGADHVGEVRHGDHDVDADYAFRLAAGLLDFASEAVDARLVVVGRVVVVDDPKTCRRYYAYATFGGYGRCQPRERYAYSHAALYDGYGGREISYLQWFHFLFGLCVATYVGTKICKYSKW